MPLAGSLRQFALPDVLRVIENGQRTGRLTVGRNDLRAAIYFSGGQWLLADRIGLNTMLAHQFVQAGLVAPEQIEAAVGIPFIEAGSIPDVQLVRVLINTRLLSQEQLRGFAVRDAINLLTVVLSWPDGEFAFEDSVPLPQGRVALPLPTGTLLAQAMRLVRGNAPSREVVPLAPETVIDFAEVDPDSGVAIQVSEEQWRLLTAVDGQTPLWAIAHRLQFSEPAVLRLASELVATGISVVVGRVAPAGG